MADSERAALEARWFELTREVLPGLAKQRGWPVRLDHCFQRILLDHACAGPWRERIAPPAYRNAPRELLRQAVAIGEAAIRGEADLEALNDQSLGWRGKGYGRC